MKLLGTIHFNVEIDASSLVGLIIKELRWIFGHGVGISPPIGSG